jgi:hypothetical protein
MLTYADSAALMRNDAFVARVKVACLHFADYILGEASTTPAHNSRMKWAQHVMDSPDIVAMQVSPPVVMDPAVQEQGEAIGDSDLQQAVETTVNKLL